MDERIKKVIGALKANNIDAIYAADKEEVKHIVRDMLFKDCIITAGGSVSVKESGVWDIISSGEYRFFNRSAAGITEEEKQRAFREAIGCDFFFCSANAVTEKGELVNVDGFSNRVSSIVFGPKKVVMIVGKNKIVRDTNEGLLRVKKIAAPKNVVRLGLDTPCAKLGHCLSLLGNDNPDFTDGCKSENRICISYVINAFQRIKNRITVIICEDELGY